MNGCLVAETQVFNAEIYSK